MRSIIHSIRTSPAPCSSGLGSLIKASPAGSMASQLDIFSSIAAFIGDGALPAIQSSMQTTFSQIISDTGPGHVTRCVFAYLSCPRDEEGAGAGAGVIDVMVFPMDFFHSVPNSTRVDIEDTLERERLKARYLTERSVAVHWWQRSWQQNADS
jgi:hypothetical protein